MTPLTPLLRIQALDQIRLTVHLPEVALGEPVQGKTVSFTIGEFPGETFTGTVARLAHSLDPNLRTMPVELDVENEGHRLLPGMSVEVEWVLERSRPRLVIPTCALVDTSEGPCVIRVRDGIAERVNISTGLSVGEETEIAGPLQEGDLVVAQPTREILTATRAFPQESR